MRLPALATALSLLAAPAVAADCTVNFTVTNSTPYHVSLVVETRTRANLNWHMGSISDGVRMWELVPGRRLARTLTMPIVGCRVQRELRVRQSCRSIDGGRGQQISERIVLPWGPGLQAPRDITFEVRC